MSMPSYAELFRGLPACPCQIEWIPKFEAHCRSTIPGFMGTLSLAQLIGLYEASGNTHGDPGGDGLRKGGGVSDFWLTGKMADLVVAEARKAGADATWHRRPNWDGDGGAEHVHSVLRGDIHATVEALTQIASVERNDDGLAGTAPDSGPRPLSGRTWREGIEWMEEQEMAQYEDQLALIIKQGEASQKRDVALRQIVKAQGELIEALADNVAEGDAEIKARITASRRKLEQAIAEAEIA